MNELIKAFTVSTLGCQCPAEVFGLIEFQRNVVRGGIELPIKIVIGGRLLIYVVDAGSSGIGDDDIQRLLEAGIAERDGSGLNRFRLVIASDDAVLRGEASVKPGSIGIEDDKTHLHVIDGNDPLLEELLASG